MHATREAVCSYASPVLLVLTLRCEAEIDDSIVSLIEVDVINSTMLRNCPVNVCPCQPMSQTRHLIDIDLDVVPRAASRALVEVLGVPRHTLRLPVQPCKHAGSGVIREPLPNIFRRELSLSTDVLPAIDFRHARFSPERADELQLEAAAKSWSHDGY